MTLPKLLFAAALASASLSRVSAGPPAGELDLSFGGTGKVSTDFGNRVDVGRSVAIRSNGKIVVAGYSAKDTTYSFAVARYRTDGSLDTGFGGTGKVTTSIGGSGFAIGQSAAFQGDGKIVVAGSCLKNGVQQFALVRYNNNGTLDTTFNGTGKVTTDFGNGKSLGQSVAIQADGKIVVAGSSGFPGHSDFALARYLPNGSLDASFNGTGKVITDFFGTNDQGQSVLVQPDGKIVLVGSSGTSMALARYNPDGSLDHSFNAVGKVTTAFPGDAAAQSVALQGDGKIVVGGYTHNAGGYDEALVRYTATGALDTSFNDTGTATFELNNPATYGTSLAVLADGRIMVAGEAYGYFMLLRYLPNGTLDPTFQDSSGLPSTQGIGVSIAVQGDGKMVVAGSVNTAGNYDFAVVRYHGDTTTEVPVLTQPASRSTSGHSLTVAFSLVEAALPGSMKLTFDDGLTIRTLTLADTLRAPGTHDFIFDPANPAATPSIVSGPALPDGVYAVTFSYQDAAGNPAVFSIPAKSVRIDTTQAIPALVTWKLTHLGNANAPDLGDPDADGLPTLVEYGLCGLPETRNDPLDIAPFSYAEGRRLRVLVPRDPAHNDVTVEVQAANSASGPWITVATSAFGAPFSGPGYVGGDDATPGLKTVEIRDTADIGSVPARFLRVRVSH